MTRQLMVAALICGSSFLFCPVMQAKSSTDKVEFADNKAEGKKKKKKKGDAAKKVKPADFSYSGKLTKSDTDGKTLYTLTTDDGAIALKGKAVNKLDEHVEKSVTINGKGKLMEKGDKKALLITKIGEVVASDN